MTRPLIITDCDEVLLHMVVPFRAWLADAHGIAFDLTQASVGAGLTYRDSGAPVPATQAGPLLDGFFATEMHRQPLIAGARDAMARLGAHADIVVLTNLLDHRRDQRRAQLRALGLDLPVATNQGGKGPAIARIMAERQPSWAVFIDDLDHHHRSASVHVPDLWRLHLVGEAELAPHYPPSTHAHARIDQWDAAEAWIMMRLGTPPPPRITHNQPGEPVS